MADRHMFQGKVYISVDFEGITGVTVWNETDMGKQDYEHFRKIMTQEVNAAVEACFEVGASDVTVRDAHGMALNILPGELHSRARLIRDWSRGPLGMMEGIDRGHDAVVFIGYHARAGTAQAPLKHTWSGRIFDLSMNGRSLPEAGLNALIAGYYDIPVVFTSGDAACCSQITELVPDIVTVAVKEGIGSSCLTLQPQVTRELIHDGVQRALMKVKTIQPLRFSGPLSLDLTFSDEPLAWHAHWYPGATLITSRTVRFVSDDFFECLRFFHFVSG